MASGATVDKFTGDGVMAFWGAPVAQQDVEIRACDAVLNIEKAIKVLQNARKSCGQPAPGMRIGVHVGHCLVGNVGTPSRLNYTLLGDTVNLASRVEALGKYYCASHIITAPCVTSSYIVRHLDTSIVKGRDEPTEMFTILGRVNDDNASELLAHRDAYAAAYENFRAGDFAEAASGFRAVAEQFPHDECAKLMSRRAQDFASSPPTSWTGVSTMTEK